MLSLLRLFLKTSNTHTKTNVPTGKTICIYKTTRIWKSAKAPKDKVDAEKAKLEKYIQQLEEVKKLLASLDEMYE